MDPSGVRRHVGLLEVGREVVDVEEQRLAEKRLNYFCESVVREETTLWRRLADQNDTHQLVRSSVQCLVIYHCEELRVDAENVALGSSKERITDTEHVIAKNDVLHAPFLMRFERNGDSLR